MGLRGCKPSIDGPEFVDNPQIIDANLQDARTLSALCGWLLNRRAARAKSRHAATVILGPSAVGATWH
jgi:hypothetical protein